MRLVAQGLRKKQIAYELGIAADTVKNHVKNIYIKLEVNDRVQATVLAMQRGLIN